MTPTDNKAVERALAIVTEDIKTPFGNFADEDLDTLALVHTVELRLLLADHAAKTEALKEIARLRTDLSGDFSMGSRQSDIARRALSSPSQKESSDHG